jgi:hypothetical protein
MSSNPNGGRNIALLLLLLRPKYQLKQGILIFPQPSQSLNLQECVGDILVNRFMPMCTLAMTNLTISFPPSPSLPWKKIVPVNVDGD